MAIYCDVCGQQLAWDKSDCCNDNIIKMREEDFPDRYYHYRCKKCGCICYPKVDKQKEE